MKAFSWLIAIFSFRRRTPGTRLGERALLHLLQMGKQLRKQMNRTEKVNRDLAELIEEYENRRSRLDEKHLKRIRAKQKLVVAIGEAVVEDLEEAQRELKFSEKAVEALRAEHQIDGDIVIPLLQSRFESVQGRLDAETAVQARRQAMASPLPLNGDMRDV